ncbi:MATE family efflux transporter [Chryseotalea sanaruensis]|uniref:Multidrug-efflux transporter n=1 Tax=Chryseotalea sanaruensis TaxID=2482724 RepID=A0A401UF48_9BACT|nr:MATE family efflux transporter [Chryseotalea sanaruensis]GCC53539.1 MATE family efflux transporter [Chryseotalea sanaruensis]
MSFFSKIKSALSLFEEALLGSEQSFTTGSIDRAIFLLSVPMIIEMGMEALFAIIDVFYVSRLNDTNAIAVIGLTETMLTIIYSIAIGLSMGATAMVARRVGEKDIKAAEVAAVQALFVGLSLSIIISIVGGIFADDLLKLMGADEGVIAAGAGYTRWMFSGNVTIMLLFLINAIFRGAGNASIAMRALVLANGLNILLDPIFIFGWGIIPGYGVEGAAIATNIGRGIGVAYQLYHLLKGKGLIRLHAQNLIIKWNIVWNLLKVSAGGTAQFVIASASWIFLVRIVSNFGSSALAGYTIAIRVIVFAILPAWGMANAAATLVGQNLGAGYPDRAEKSVWRTAFFNMIFLGLVTILFFSMADPILRLFTNEPEVLENGILCLQIVSLGYIFYAYGMVISQAFNGAGDTATPTVLNFFGFWTFQIPLAYALAIIFEFGPPGVYAAISIAESCIAIVAVIIFKRGKWKLVKI